MTAKIVFENIDNYEGRNNRPERYAAWGNLGLYKNLNTLWITPTRGTCATITAFSWMNVIGPPNSCVCKMRIEKMEVGQAYNEAITTMLKSPWGSKFNYVLTVEEDNLPPPDGLLKLFESIQNYDAVGGLYWIKGEGGAPMIWGDPKEPGTFVPQSPKSDTVQECNGLGMGFTLFRADMFKDPRFDFGKWFQTVGEKGSYMTQDLYFFKKAQELGYKFACDTRVKVGHYDAETGIIW